MTDFKLVRTSIGPEGTFGVLYHGGKPFAVTLERVFDEDGATRPVIPAGEYLCRRTTFYRGGYTTYEVTGVEEHSRLLLHKGNFERDSEGCILVADGFQDTWVTNSKVGFAKFMDRAAGRSQVTLTIVDPPV